MLFFTSQNILATAIIVCLCVSMQSASAKAGQGSRARLDGMSRYRTTESKSTKPVEVARPPQELENRHNTSSTSSPRTKAGVRGRKGDRSTPRNVPSRKYTSKGKPSIGKKLGKAQVPTPTKQRRQNNQPTPEPTGDASTATTVYANGPGEFALLLPQGSGEMVSEAESDGVAYCTDGSGCDNPFPSGFITGAAYSAAADGSYVQVTGCMDSSKFPFAGNDDGGQFDVRYPNGAQCTFGGYGASFIEQVEPSANRFCLRCCKSVDDQQNCNSHEDRAGCAVAVPGTYTFGGINCS